jgi:hypothetical protein
MCFLSCSYFLHCVVLLKNGFSAPHLTHAAANFGDFLQLVFLLSFFMC